jgi:hypothetical protein
MSKISFFFIFFLYTAVSMAQEVVYDKNAEARKVDAFTSIEVSGPITLYLSQSGDNVVAVSADEEKYNSKIVTEVSNGKLSVSVDGGLWNTYSMGNRKLRAYISVKDLNRISLTGPALLVIKGTLSGTALKIETSGASELKGDIKIENLKLDGSGGSIIKLSGAVTSAKLDISGGCKIKAANLIIDDADIDASGGGAITVVVSKELKADASGGAVIKYIGSPKIIKRDMSGGATIKNQKEGD